MDITTNVERVKNFLTYTCGLRPEQAIKVMEIAIKELKEEI